MIVCKRIYDEPAIDDGFRVLVDRLWPRGITKERAALDLWLKDVAPNAELRTWFDHRTDQFDVFRERYVTQLTTNPAVDELRLLVVEHDIVTLLYGARDPHVNHAVVLADYLSNAGTT